MRNDPHAAHSPRPSNDELFLIAGDSTDLNVIRSRLKALPNDARGQVFVEVFAPIQVSRLDAPHGVAVNWVMRDTHEHDGIRRAIAPRGAGLVRAVNAWLDEWMRADSLDSDNYRIWLGACSSPTVNAYYDELSHELAERDRARARPPRVVNPLRADSATPHS